MIMLGKANKKQVNCSDFDLDRINLFLVLIVCIYNSSLPLTIREKLSQCGIFLSE